MSSDKEVLNIPVSPETAYWLGRYHEAVKVREEERRQINEMIERLLQALPYLAAKSVPSV